MTTIDVTPDNTNKLAYLMGRIFHPYLICIPTVFILLGDMPMGEAAKWTLLVLSIILTPLILVSAYMEMRQRRYIYQRSTRGPIYVIFFLSVLACLALLIIFNAPRILIACFVTLLIWASVQLLINHYVTKISTHAGVVAACSTGLLLAGKLNHPILLVLMIVIAVTTLWARVQTKNHTVPQVIMGFLVGALAVLIVFPLMLS